ncbi:hypothetical protein PybrP1_001315, partial [[Pythium] brassicae (nom. inval.)]
ATLVAPLVVAKRQASELAAEELQAECGRYSVPGGDTLSRMTALQLKYDDEYDAAQRELAAFERRLEDARRSEEFLSAARTLEALEQSALDREPKIRAIEQQIAQSIAPKRLVVRGLSPLACCALLRAMRTNTSVLSLDLANNELGDAVADSLRKLLERNKRLQALDLGFNELTHQSLGAIGRALRGNTVLATVVLESNPVLNPSKDAPAGSGAAGEAASSASSASLHGTASSNIEAFAAAVASTASLTALNLFNTQMSYEVGRSLAQAFAKNASIVALEVGGNALLQSDVALFASHLRRNQQRADAAQRTAADLHCEMAERAEAARAEQASQEQECANRAWHEANAAQRAERREQDEWERARACAEADVRRLAEIAALDKQYRERLAAEKKAKGAKGRK